MSEESAKMQRLAHEAATVLDLNMPIAFPAELAELLDRDAENIVFGCGHLDAVITASELGLLAADMAAYYADYEFGAYMPGAWPFALDGGGGFFCLDLRELIQGAHANDSSHPVVWSHASTLGWDCEDHVVIAPDFTAFLALITGNHP